MQWVQWLQDSQVVQMRAGLVQARNSQRKVKELVQVMTNQLSNELKVREAKLEKENMERKDRVEQSLTLLRQLERERDDECCDLGRCTVS